MCATVRFFTPIMGWLEAASDWPAIGSPATVDDFSVSMLKVYVIYFSSHTGVAGAALRLARSKGKRAI